MDGRGAWSRLVCSGYNYVDIIRRICSCLSRLAEEAEAAEPGAGPEKLAKAKARYGKASEQVRPGGPDGRGERERLLAVWQPKEG